MFCVSLCLCLHTSRDVSCFPVSMFTHFTWCFVFPCVHVYTLHVMFRVSLCLCLHTSRDLSCFPVSFFTRFKWCFVFPCVYVYTLHVMFRVSLCLCLHASRDDSCFSVYNYTLQRMLKNDHDNDDDHYDHDHDDVRRRRLWLTSLADVEADLTVGDIVWLSTEWELDRTVLTLTAKNAFDLFVFSNHDLNSLVISQVGQYSLKKVPERHAPAPGT